MAVVSPHWSKGTQRAMLYQHCYRSVSELGAAKGNNERKAARVQSGDSF